MDYASVYLTKFSTSGFQWETRLPGGFRGSGHDGLVSQHIHGSLAKG